MRPNRWGMTRVAGVSALFALLAVGSCGTESANINGSPGSDSGTGGGGDSMSLGGEGGSRGSNAEGCTCSQAGQSAACWTGPADQRNKGTCHDGTTQCMNKGGEFPVWGPCVGEELNCGGGDGGGHEDSGGVGEGGGGHEDSGGNGDGGGGQEDAGCPPPNQNGMCPLGTWPQTHVYIDGGWPLNEGGVFEAWTCCIPCDATTCDKPACCATSACSGAPQCAMCAGQQLDPSCNGYVDSDCDDFPEDCDELCCPCKPAGSCPSCPQGEISCNGTCVNAVSDPTHCGACDVTCGNKQCVSGVCQ